MAAITYQYRLISSGTAPGETRLEIVKSGGDGECGVSVAYQNTGLRTPHAGNTLQRKPSTEDVFLGGVEPSRCACITPVPQWAESDCEHTTDPFAGDLPVYANSNWPKRLAVRFSDIEEIDVEHSSPESNDNNCWLDFSPSFTDFLTSSTFILEGTDEPLGSWPPGWHWRTGGDFFASWESGGSPGEYQPWIASEVYSISDELCPTSSALGPVMSRVQIQYALRMTLWPCRDDLYDPEPTETRRGRIILDLLKIVRLAIPDAAPTGSEEIWYPSPSMWIYRTGYAPIDLTKSLTVPAAGLITGISMAYRTDSIESDIRIGTITISPMA